MVFSRTKLITCWPLSTMPTWELQVESSVDQSSICSCCFPHPRAVACFLTFIFERIERFEMGRAPPFKMATTFLGKVSINQILEVKSYFLVSWRTHHLINSTKRVTILWCGSCNPAHLCHTVVVLGRTHSMEEFEGFQVCLGLSSRELSYWILRFLLQSCS